MTKTDVIERLCGLTSRVMNEQFNANYPADCFCEQGVPFGEYRFDERILVFIERAVRRALDEEPAREGYGRIADLVRQADAAVVELHRLGRMYVPPSSIGAILKQAESLAEMRGPHRAETPDPCPRSDIGSRDEVLGLTHLDVEPE